MRGVAALVVLGSLTVAAQQQIPRFQSGVDVVQFTVTVLDKDRHPVSGLTAADFDVLVDGQPRPLAAFAAVTLPDDPSTIPPVAPDVHTNQLRAEGRLVVIVMDRSIGIGNPMRAAQAIASAAIDHLGPADLAGVVYTEDAVRMFSHGLTADRARLRAAVSQLYVGASDEPPPPPSLGAFAASRGAPQGPMAQSRVRIAENDEDYSSKCFCGVCVPDALTALARTLTGGMARRKSILFIGSSIALESTNPTGHCAALIYPARDKLTRALDEVNVTFHAVDPNGLENHGEAGELAARIGQANITRQASLEILPAYTGGRLVMNSNTPEDAIGQIFDEDSSYYVLAIPREPAAAKGEDRHRIKIAVKRSDVTVRARNLYFAAPDAKASREQGATPAAHALNELLPRADFPLHMNLVPQFFGAPAIRVTLGVDSKVAGNLDVLIRAYDRVFKPIGTPVKQRLDVPAAAVAGSSEFQWSTVLTNVPPGDYEVRAAVATADGQRAASVIGYVDVPAAPSRELALSGIVIKAGGTPTLQRDFAAGTGIGVWFQVARESNASAAASVHFAIRDDLGQIVASLDVPHERAVAVAPGVEGYDIGVRLPRAPGRYVITIEASDGRRSVHRDVPVAVR